MLIAHINMTCVVGFLWMNWTFYVNIKYFIEVCQLILMEYRSESSHSIVGQYRVPLKAAGSSPFTYRCHMSGHCVVINLPLTPHAHSEIFYKKKIIFQSFPFIRYCRSLANSKDLYYYAIQSSRQLQVLAILTLTPKIDCFHRVA